MESGRKRLRKVSDHLINQKKAAATKRVCVDHTLASNYRVYKGCTILNSMSLGARDTFQALPACRSGGVFKKQESTVACSHCMCTLSHMASQQRRVEEGEH